MLEKQIKRQRRHKKVRSRIKDEFPRLCVFRSAKHIYAQIIKDDKTLVSASDLEIKSKDKKASVSEKVGKLIAEKAVAKKIEKVVFDRGGYKYHGRIKALADGARANGLKF
jgi:large subunit ribosomal protein L18